LGQKDEHGSEVHDSGEFLQKKCELSSYNRNCNIPLYMSVVGLFASRHSISLVQSENFYRIADVEDVSAISLVVHLFQQSKDGNADLE
jgi:hypothetical protein